MIVPFLSLHIVALYVGPDQLLPLTSILGAIGGAVMIFWRQLKAIVQRFVGLFRRRSD
jgi:hypothetical protein